LKKQGGESELKKPRVGVQCRVKDKNRKIHSRSLRGTKSLRVMGAIVARFSSLKKISGLKKIYALLLAAQKAPYTTVLKVAFMASIPSIALRR
jgi:hypothetical protein